MSCKNIVHYDEAGKSVDFYVTSPEIIDKLMETIENMAHEAIAENDYKQTLELVSMLVDGEEAIKKFNQSKIKPTYPRTSTELLEDE